MAAVPASPVILLALPLSRPDGMDEYNGVMRYLREKKLSWDLRIVRGGYSASLFDVFPITGLSGIICGVDIIPDIMESVPRYPLDILEAAEKADVPFVGLDVPISENVRSGAGRTVLLNIDSKRIGRAAARELLEGKYASYGFFSAFSAFSWSEERMTSFKKTLKREGGVDVYVYPGNTTQDNAALSEWLRLLPKPSVVFAANDVSANQILKVCAADSIRVPDDLAVLGVDDDPVFCVHTKPSLSSLHPDFHAEGYAAAKAMHELLSGRRLGRIAVVDCDVACTHRSSTAPCSPAGRLVRKAEEIIAAKALTGLSSDALAAELGISRRLLDQRFRQITGNSVRETIERIKLRNVKRLLKVSVLTHREIAASCAFSSSVYLETVFVKRFGMTMSEYRASKQM